MDFRSPNIENHNKNSVTRRRYISLSDKHLIRAEHRFLASLVCRGGIRPFWTVVSPADSSRALSMNDGIDESV